jgi:uncharacterized membrane protein (DUF106 family)
LGAFSCLPAIPLARRESSLTERKDTGVGGVEASVSIIEQYGIVGLLVLIVAAIVWGLFVPRAQYLVIVQQWADRYKERDELRQQQYDELMARYTKMEAIATSVSELAKTAAESLKLLQEQHRRAQTRRKQIRRRRT